MYTYQLFADRLDQQSCYYGRINPSGQCEQNLLVSDLTAKLGYLLFDEFFSECGGCDTFHVFRTLIVFHECLLLRNVKMNKNIILKPTLFGKFFLTNHRNLCFGL